ncbi:MAG: hypothetical protein IPF73_09020 [Betaproteobacteria bacterium]|nr:hypothetical protein [Betaproteobacteria bacterium]
MFVGHLGAGLAVKAAEPRWNLGVLFAAALFADLLLWVLVLFGVESVGASVQSGRARFFTFAFPISHGALASAGWTLAAATLGWIVAGTGTPRRARLACTLAIAVASHFVLDLVVHVPDLPVAGGDSAKLGLGLWRAMPAALAVELALAVAALAVCMRRVRPCPLARRAARHGRRGHGHPDGTGPLPARRAAARNHPGRLVARHARRHRRPGIRRGRAGPMGGAAPRQPLTLRQPGIASRRNPGDAPRPL